jgi:hypothetical protein
VIKGLLGVAIFISAFVEFQAVLLTLHLKSHHVEGWYLEAFILVVATLLPWLWALTGYRRFKAAIIVSGGSQNSLLALQYHGVMLLFWSYLAMMLILNVLMMFSNFTRLSPN